MATSNISRRSLIAGAAAAGVAAGVGAVVPGIAQAAESKFSSFGGLFGSSGGGETDAVEVDDPGVPAESQDAGETAFVDAICAHLDQIGIIYTRDEDGLLKVSYSFDSANPPSSSFIVRLRIKSNSFGSFAHLWSWPYSNASGLEQPAIEACNAANADYYWTTFYLDGDSDITVNIDTYVDLATCGPVCADLFGRMASIIDSAYADHFVGISTAVG